MTKQQANYYLYRCYRLLEDPETVLRHKKFRGNLHGIAFAAVNSMTVVAAMLITSGKQIRRTSR